MGGKRRRRDKDVGLRYNRRTKVWAIRRSGENEIFLHLLLQNLVFCEICTNIETASRRYFRSKIKEKAIFSLYFARLFVPLTFKKVEIRLHLEKTQIKFGFLLDLH